MSDKKEAGVTFNWNAVEEHGGAELFDELAKGSTGKMHRLNVGDMALRAAMQKGQEDAAGRNFLLELGKKLVLAAWEAEPLDGGTASQLLALDSMQPFLSPSVRNAAAAVKESWKQPEDLRYLNRLLQKRDAELTLSYLDKQATKDSANTFWMQQHLAVAAYEGMFDRGMAAIASATLPEPVKKRLLADWKFLQRDFEGAAVLYEQAWSESSPEVTEHLIRRAEALIRAGARDDATRVWKSALVRRGWDSSLTLRLHDVLTGFDMKKTKPEGRGAVLLYTWNKDSALDIALGSLFASELYDAGIVVLNNGSTDETPAVLQKWQQTFGERMHVVTLPCNVGAPAARNWLMHLSELDDCSWVAYLDDDVDLPVDWLGRLGAVKQEFADAAAWGCRVVDHANPALMQAVDMHVDPAPEQTPEEIASSGERRFTVSTLHHQDMDFGQFAYARPCATVTGCCHMFSLKALRAGGGFDLRYSPSQYDDLEHDLRHVLQGRVPVYQGHLVVRHMKRSGKAAVSSMPEHGNASSNLYKLHMRYTIEEYDIMRRNNAAAIKQDLLHKVSVLAG
ncbi:glycosyltransferase family 2 protein [Oleidesulfovibrio sp.]|uniref:glycosyltransferase family 2 protein n=1 Tax=Oleidesulfovibrio sp. TaxID=2909707 RepID=UPI003A8BFE06